MTERIRIHGQPVTVNGNGMYRREEQGLVTDSYESMASIIEDRYLSINDVEKIKEDYLDFEGRDIDYIEFIEDKRGEPAIQRLIKFFGVGDEFDILSKLIY